MIVGFSAILEVFSFVFVFLNFSILWELFPQPLLCYSPVKKLPSSVILGPFTEERAINCFEEL